MPSPHLPLSFLRNRSPLPQNLAWHLRRLYTSRSCTKQSDLVLGTDWTFNHDYPAHVVAPQLLLSLHIPMQATSSKSHFCAVHPSLPSKIYRSIMGVIYCKSVLSCCPCLIVATTR